MGSSDSRLPFLPIAKPWLTESEATAAHDVVLGGQVLQGPRVLAFEQAFSAYSGAACALAVANGTAALILALKAVGVSAGDVVLTVSHSFIATANAVRACGAEPVFVDVEQGGYNIDPKKLCEVLEEGCDVAEHQLWYRKVDDLLALTESPLHRVAKPFGRVAAVLVVHQIGMPCSIQEIASACQEFGIPMVEDAACAVGSRVLSDEEWRPIGLPFGAAACFSFHPRKLITTGDGGMITTNSTAMFEHMRLLRQHGMSGSPGAGAMTDFYPVTGYNYRLTDIQAAIGSLQLHRLDEQIEERRRLAALYQGALSDDLRFRVPVEPSGSFWNWQSLPVEFDPEQVSQQMLLQHLSESGIAGKPGIMNAHEEPPYAGLWHLPESERRRRSSIFVPLFYGMRDEDVARVIRSLQNFQV